MSNVNPPNVCSCHWTAAAKISEKFPSSVLQGSSLPTTDSQISKHSMFSTLNKINFTILYTCGPTLMGVADMQCSCRSSKFKPGNMPSLAFVSIFSSANTSRYIVVCFHVLYAKGTQANESIIQSTCKFSYHGVQ